MDSLCVKNTACTIRHITYAKSTWSNSRANSVLADNISVHCVSCIERLLHVGREKGTSRMNCQAFGQVGERTPKEGHHSPDPRGVKARVWVRLARARAPVSRSTYGSHLVFYLSLWAIRTPGSGSFGLLLYLPLFSSGSSTSAPQARPRRESVLPSRPAKKRPAAWKKKMLAGVLARKVLSLFYYYQQICGEVINKKI